MLLDTLTMTGSFSAVGVEDRPFSPDSLVFNIQPEAARVGWEPLGPGVADMGTGPTHTICPQSVC